MLVTLIMLERGFENPKTTSKTFSHLWSLGLGRVSVEMLVTLSGSGTGSFDPRSASYGDQVKLITCVFLANLPQALLSFAFLAYNGIFTSMLMGKEWSEYALERKSLRVTLPRGMQRSTYRLQLPYTYGLPLLFLSAILHWLVSQSLFPVRIVVIDETTKENPFTTIGYSMLGIITTFAVSGIALFISILMGFRHYDPGLPIIGSSSIAISQQCCRPIEDVAAAIKPVMWGVPKFG